MLGTVPVIFLMKPGELRLNAGRLTFTTDDGSVPLDAPVAELHSVEKSVMGIQVWQGAERYRFAFTRSNRGKPPDEIREIADSWVRLLEPLQGAAPANVPVRSPWPMWRWGVAIIGILVVVLAAAGFLFAIHG